MTPESGAEIEARPKSPAPGPRLAPEMRASSTSSRSVPAPPAAKTPPATRELWPTVFPATLVLSDALALVAALFATYAIRFQSGLFPTPLGVPELSAYAVALVVLVPAGLVTIAREGMYAPRRRARVSRDVVDAARASGMLALLLVAAAFFYREFSFSRSMLAGFWLAATFFVTLFRRFASRAHRAFHARGFGLERVVLVGGGPMAARLAQRIVEQPGFGIRIVGEIEGLDWRAAQDDATSRAGRLARIRGLAEGGTVDRVILTDPHLSHDERLDFLEECHAFGVTCDFVPDLFDVLSGRLRVEEIDGVPLVGAKLHPLGRAARMQKRTLDVVISAGTMLLFAPLFAFLALLVKLDSPGPVFYRQRRLGRDGREFEILKFRSLPMDAEAASGPLRATRGDTRATRIGALLRRSSLDELPQLANVLKGEMSLVGPRPERPVFVGQYRTDVPRYLERHGVKSGITGWAQVNGLRGDTSIEERTRYDLWYVENWSLTLDVKILLLTSVRFLFQKEAY